MKHAPRILVILGAGIAACFGAGPTPTTGSDVTVVFSVPPPDVGRCQASFISAVAIGSNAGYAAIATHGLSSCGMWGFISPNGDPITLHQFALDGAGSSALGQVPSMGANMTLLPRVAATDTGPVWAYASTGTSGPGVQIMLGSGGSGDTSLPADVPIGPAALAFDAAAHVLYAAGMSQQQAQSQTVDSPTFPCCGNMMGIQTGQGIVESVPPGLSLRPSLYCAQADRCLAQNSSALYYFSLGNGAYSITKVDKIAHTGSDLATEPTVGAVSSAAGIDANDSWVAWTSTVMFSANSTTAGCTVSWLDVTKDPPVLDSWTMQRYSCMDMAVAGDFAYFALVTTVGSDPNNKTVQGNGVGRLNLRTKDFASIDTGTVGPSSGPRRVYVDANYIYAVAPEIIGRILRSGFDGHQDLAP